MTSSQRPSVRLIPSARQAASSIWSTATWPARVSFVSSAMWSEIARLRDAEGLTILLTTHYLEEADQLAANLAIVDRGRVVAEGTPEALKAGLRGDAVHVELDAHAIAVASVTVARPSLDDVYLRFAGRSFAAAEAADPKKEEAR
jgi:ABC-2 type transport system ATP-binding protein